MWAVGSGFLRCKGPREIFEGKDGVGEDKREG